MGHGFRVDGGIKIPTFIPDDTETEKYIRSGWGEYTLGDILDFARQKWGENIGLEDITIAAENIQTDCIGYDMFDPRNYENYLVITLRKQQT